MLLSLTTFYRARQPLQALYKRLLQNLSSPNRFRSPEAYRVAPNPRNPAGPASSNHGLQHGPSTEIFRFRHSSNRGDGRLRLRIGGHSIPETGVRNENQRKEAITGKRTGSSTTPDNKALPIAFHSRKFTSTEANYDACDKELLAIVDNFKKLRRLLEVARHQFQIITDHNNLGLFMTTKILYRRQARWAQEPAGYDFKI